MTSALIWAALLGLTLGAGLLLILVTQPVGWRPSLEQRVEPQLRHHIPASRLLEEERAGAERGLQQTLTCMSYCTSEDSHCVPRFVFCGYLSRGSSCTTRTAPFETG